MFLYDVQSVFCICLRADKGSLTFLTSLDVFNIQYRVTVCKNLCRNVTAVHDRSIYWKEIWEKSNYFFSCVYYLYFRGFRSVSKLFISFRFTVFVSTYKEVSSTRQYKYIHPSRLIPTLCMEKKGNLEKKGDCSQSISLLHSERFSTEYSGFPYSQNHHSKFQFD